MPSKYRVGERVRYVGHKFHWLHQTGVVTEVRKDGYDIIWDDPKVTHTRRGVGIAESSFEPVVDWTQPVELNDGTPMIVLARWEHHVLLRTADGRDHPAQSRSPKWRLDARIDNGLVLSNHKFYVRNRIMSKLDPNRELRIVYDGDPVGRVVPFITETSEGHLLVGRAKAGSSAWSIYDKEGNWVRSEDGAGKVTRLINPTQTVERYATIFSDGSIDALRRLPNHASEGTAHVRYTFTDGILTGVEIVQANGSPINVD